jgi:8-oxo-dGTP diphosphatase
MDFKKLTIKTAVVACIVDDRDRVLLTRRCVEPFCSQWVMPGGKIDHGEGILAALHREVREEVGLEIRVGGLIDVFEQIGVGSRNDHYVILYYRCTPESNRVVPNGQECTDAVWAPKSRLPGMNLPPGCRHILAQVFPGLPWGATAPPDDAEMELLENIEACGS